VSQSRPTDPEANAYAESYVLYGDQSKAWRIAFPSSKAKPKAVHEKASTFHRIEKVQQRIKEIRQTLKIQAEEKFQISSEQLQKTLAMVMKKGLAEKIDAQGNKVAHALPAVVSAVGEINKMNGNHAAVKSDLTSSDGTMTPKSFNEFYSEQS
jgi:hypothetical protein